MHTENYNIHNILSFQIRNDRLNGFLKNFNPEYEYFRTSEAINPDFRITVTKQLPIIEDKQRTKHIFTKEYTTWSVCIIEEHSGFVDLYVQPRLTGIRTLISYTAIKNIYVRSLLYYCLIKKGGTLIHSSGVQINGKSCLFVGRPGVFKTSILMDLIRLNKYAFIGEENSIIHGGNLYSFPFHLRSLDFRIRYYKNEDPPALLHKYAQVLYLFSNQKPRFKICIKSRINTVFYVEKGEVYNCKEVLLNEIIDKFINNEIAELDIKCNPRLSAGISNNHFSDYLMHTNQKLFIESALEKVFLDQLKNCTIYSLIVPKNYSWSIVKNIVQILNP